MSSSNDGLPLMGKVIPASRTEASSGTGSADIRNLLKSTEERNQQIFEEARTRGLASGSEAGRRDFLKATAEAVRQIHDELLALEPMLAPVVSLAFEKILGKLPPQDVAMAALSEALRETGAGVTVTLRVSPDDVEDMRRSWRALLTIQPELAPALHAIEADAGLHRGEMILETLKGRTHIGIAYQLSRLKFGILGSGA